MFNPVNRLESDHSIYAAAGLYYNFDLIKFTKEASQSKCEGIYIKVNEKTSGDVTGKEFIKKETAEEVHNLTLAELNKARGESETSGTDVDDNDAATGLFYLRDLEEFGYESMTTSTDYWLASPTTKALNSLILHVWGDSIQGNNDGKALGVRPVILLKSNIEIEK